MDVNRYDKIVHVRHKIERLIFFTCTFLQLGRRVDFGIHAFLLEYQCSTGQSWRLVSVSVLVLVLVLVRRSSLRLFIIIRVYAYAYCSS